VLVGGRRGPGTVPGRLRRRPHLAGPADRRRARGAGGGVGGAFVRPFRALTAGRRFPDVRSRSQPIGRPGREPHDVARPGRREEGIVRVLPPAAVLLLALLGACAQARGPAPPTTTTASLPPWTWELPACPAYRAADYAAPEHRVSVQVAADATVT